MSAVDMVADLLARGWAYRAEGGAVVFDAARAPADLYVAVWRAFEPARTDPGSRDFPLWVPNDAGDPGPWGIGSFTENAERMLALLE